MILFVNIRKKKILIFTLITYLFISYYYYYYYFYSLLENFSNLEIFLFWFILWLIYIIFIHIFFFYFYIIFFFFEKFINDQVSVKYKNLNIINVEENVHFKILINTFKSIDSHPFINYYFDSSDLSINLKCELQWIKYGWKFFETIKKSLNDEQIIQNYLTYDSVFIHNNTIQSIIELKRFKNKKHNIQIIITDKVTISTASIFDFDKLFKNFSYIIESESDIENLIETLNNFNINLFNNSSFNHMYSEKDLVYFKIKLNIIEYIVFSSKKLKPTIKCNDKNA